MVENNFSQLLFNRIREKCWRDGWYGGKVLSPTSIVGIRDDDPQRIAFAFPPASEEQLHTTEAALGFPLPPLLRGLYAHVANGGFGPGAGIRGAIGGYGTRMDPEDSYDFDDTIVGYYDFHRKRARLIDLAQYALQWRLGKSMAEYLILPYGIWPKQLLSLCDLGCCREACLDVKSGIIVCTAPTSNEQYVVRLLSPSVERWLEQWLSGENLL